MRFYSSRLLYIAALAAAAVSFLGSATPAARGHWGGGRWGGCWGHGFYRPYYGVGYGVGAFGLGLGLGYGLGYGLGGSYAPYYGGYAPYYGAYGPAVYPPVIAASSTAAPNSDSTFASSRSQPPQDNAAHLQLTVPAAAEVSFSGTRIPQEGRVRECVSPPLAPGRTYNYRIVVRYTDTAGKVVEDKRDIQVRANDWFSIDFTRPPPSEKLTPVTAPSP